MRRRVWATFLASVLLVALAGGASLPLTRYTAADGLPHDRVNRIRADSRGFLWFATAAGLAHFDSFSFTTVGTAKDILGASVSDLIETKSGSYWVASSNGLFWFRPQDQPKGGQPLHAVELRGVEDQERPSALLEASDGAVWAGTSRSLFRIETTGAEPVAKRIGPDDDQALTAIITLAQASDGVIWAGTLGGGLLRVDRNSETVRFPLEALPTSRLNNIRGLAFDKDGILWASTFGGVLLLDVSDPKSAPRIKQAFGDTDGLPSQNCGGVYATHDHRMFVSTVAGATEFTSTEAGVWHVSRVLSSRDGLGSDWVTTFAEDSGGGLWIGTTTSGVSRVAHTGFETIEWSSTPGTRIVDLALDRRGQIRALAFVRDERMQLIDPARAPSAAYDIRLPASINYLGWGDTQKVVQTGRGEWWIATGGGACRFANSELLQMPQGPPLQCLTQRDGLLGADIFALFEDSRGNVWLSTQAIPNGAIDRWTPATSQLRTWRLDSLHVAAIASCFAETSDGSVWAGYLDGHITRFRDGTAQTWASGLPTVDVLWVDRRGQLWILGDDVRVCRDPSAALPLSETFAAIPELDQRHTNCITEDRLGRLYFGTDRGVLRLDPSSSSVRLFNMRDGLPGNIAQFCQSDAHGTLWFSDTFGLARLVPQDDPASAAPQIQLVAAQVGGESQALPVLGTQRAGPYTLSAPPNQIAFDFVSVGFQAGERARYQFRLVGADRDWSPVGDRRSVQYANLSAGNYSFEVRAVNGDGVFSPQPAVARIRVLAPVWRRGWFIAVWLALLGGLVYWAHRQRVGRLLAMERMRTRIATDLHDDLGSSLSQIAVLSQLAHDSVRRGAAASERSLSRITELSGELVDALGDVVWAINPASDSLAELASRMRRFASDLFADKQVKVRMSLPPRETRVQLDPQVRRHIYLVFKEALHNVQRHARATRVDVVLCRAGHGWMLRITDDGRGFDLAVASKGHGLASLASRAKRLGGTLTIRSSPTEGTDLLLLTDPQASVPTQLSSEIVDWPTDSRAW